MKTRPRLAQFVWIVLAAGLLVGATYVQPPLDQRSQKLGLEVPALDKNHPELGLLNWMPGGLRAPLVCYYWITTDQLKQEGRFYDALNRAELICALEPHFPGVWAFQAWNMAWNIAVATHTPQERWQWVYNGMILLRDKGIPLNPQSQVLYHELAWNYFSKMGGDLDEMHMVYKARWAALMQRLLAAPPGGDTESVIDAFRPIADPALLDLTIPPDPEKPIQAARLKAMLEKNPAAAALAAQLAELDVKADWSLLDAYNRFSNEYPAAVVRVAPHRPRDAREQSIEKLLNDKNSAPALHSLLAFVRAQLLYNVYKMEPKFMLDLMVKYDAPLDWRHPYSHGLYWSMLGIERCKALNNADIDALKSDRIAMFCLNNLTWYGRLSYVENPLNPDYPRLTRTADPRFIRATHEQSMEFIKAVAKVRDNEKFDENVFKEGHRNYLIAAIQMLYPAGKVKKAQELFDFLKNDYRMKDPAGREGIWASRDIKEFVTKSINEQGKPIPALAITQISSSLQTAFADLALGDPDSMTEYREMLDYALGVYKLYQANAVERNKFAPIEDLAATQLAQLLIEPRDIGFNQLYPITTRSQLYVALQTEWPQLLPMVYDTIALQLKPQCDMAGINFDKAFPVPPGLDAYRAKRRSMMTPTLGK